MLPSLTELSLDDHDGKYATVAPVGVIAIPPMDTTPRKKGLARVVAMLEEELIREAEAGYLQEASEATSFQPAEQWLSAPAARVLTSLRAAGLPLSLNRRDGARLVGEPVLGLLEAQLSAWADVAELVKMANELMEEGDSSSTPVFVSKGNGPNGTLLAIVALWLDDSVAQSIEFGEKLPNSEYRQWHADLDTATDAQQVSFWNVVTLEMFNEVADTRRRDGYEEHLKADFPQPFVLAARTKIGMGGLGGRLASSFLVYNDSSDLFDNYRLNQEPNTMSKWPRVKVSLLVPNYATNLMAVSPTRLENYENCVLAFHGTTRRSAVSIDQGFNFSAANRQQLGAGFYVTTNFNEAKAYSLQHIAFKQNNTNYQKPEAPNAAYSDLEVAVVCVILIKGAHSIKRVPFGHVTSDQAQNGCTFVLNPNLAAGQQVCLHGGVEPLMRLVAVHDIDARGQIWSTGIYDTAHNQLAGTPGGPVRGVLAAA